MRHEDDDYEYDHDEQDNRESGLRYKRGAFGGYYRKYPTLESEVM